MVARTSHFLNYNRKNYFSDRIKEVNIYQLNNNELSLIKIISEEMAMVDAEQNMFPERSFRQTNV